MSSEAVANDHHDDHHDGEHHLPPALVYSMSKLGMWLFLATEVLLFAGLFATYAVYRYKNPEMWQGSAVALSVPMGAANTILLLASSFTVAWAVDAIKRGHKILVQWLLIITIAMGAAFMVNKYFEYSHKTHEIALIETAIDPVLRAAKDKDGKCFTDLSSGKSVRKCKVIPFDPAAIGKATAEKPVFANLFFFQYFVMTGIHGLHIIIGLGIFTWILSLSFRDKLDEKWFTPVEIGGLYWHLVDLIWIYLFPMLYLVA